MPQSKKQAEMQQKLDEATADLQRTRADFENYRKRVEQEKVSARDAGRASAVLKLLPVIDNIERAIRYAPDDIADHSWVKSVLGLQKQLDKNLESLGVARIDAETGNDFNPEYHEAIQFDEDAEGEKEVIAEVLQAGYMLDAVVMRHAMVKVTRK